MKDNLTVIAILGILGFLVVDKPEPEPEPEPEPTPITIVEPEPEPIGSIEVEEEEEEPQAQHTYKGHWEYKRQGIFRRVKVWVQ